MRGKALPFLLGLALLASFCGRPGTEEDAILSVIDSLAGLAERNDVEGMMAFFAEDFVDFEGRDIEGLRSLLQGYFSGRTGIVAHRLSGRLVRLEEGEGEYQAEVALSSGGAEALRRLVRISPDIYRLKIELAKAAGEWRVTFAEWEWISLAEILPESLESLKKVFPRL